MTGEGVFQVPVGPVHAGIIEPGHFRFGVAGEPVLYLQLRLFYVHKGTEKRFERLPWRHGLFLAESISGDTAVGHALAYAHAIERLAGVDGPAARIARCASCCWSSSASTTTSPTSARVATDVAFTVPASRAQAHARGSRPVAGRSCSAHGCCGARSRSAASARDLTADGREALRTHLARFEKEFDELITSLIDAGTFTDRVDGTGILTNQAARDLGIVGMAARASGVDTDFRRDHPHDGYEACASTCPSKTEATSGRG